MEKTVKINNKEVPCKDVISITRVFVSDTFMYKILYNEFEPCYHRVEVLLPQKKGYEIEKKVRKNMNKR